MTTTPREIVEAFSRHLFGATYPHLHRDVRWELVGGRTFEGKDAVIAACEESAAYLAGVTTTFRKLRVIAGEESVAVETVVDYDEPGSSTTVASCDVYLFADGQVAEIVSYNVELHLDALPGAV